MLRLCVCLVLAGLMGCTGGAGATNSPPVSQVDVSPASSTGLPSPSEPSAAHAPTAARDAAVVPDDDHAGPEECATRRELLAKLRKPAPDKEAGERMLAEILGRGLQRVFQRGTGAGPRPADCPSRDELKTAFDAWKRSFEVPEKDDVRFVDGGP